MLPLDQCDMHLGQNLARCPRTTLEVGWWLRGFRRASSTVIVQRARHRHVAPCVVCVLGLPQLVVLAAALAAARRPPRPTHLAISPERMPLTHGCRRPPPDMPAPGIEPTTLRLRDLRLARLSEPGILCVRARVCLDVCACARVCVHLCMHVQGRH